MGKKERGKKSPQLEKGSDTAGSYSEMEMRVRSVLFALRDRGQKDETARKHTRLLR